MNNKRLYRVICYTTGEFAVEHLVGEDSYELVALCGKGEAGYNKATTLRGSLIAKK